MISAILALFQFTTVLPLGKTAPFDAFVSNSWLYPLSGYLIGGIAALFILTISSASYLTATLAISIVILISGANHLDGLLDLGDGLMAHGSLEKRITALTDRQTGSGALAAGIITTLISVMALGSTSSVIYMAASILIAETGSKWAMEFLTVTGKPFHEGLHSELHKKSRYWFLIPSTILLLPLFFLPIPIKGITWGLLTALIVPVIIRYISYRTFGGVNGDVTGATGEISRAIILTTISYSII